MVLRRLPSNVVSLARGLLLGVSLRGRVVRFVLLIGLAPLLGMALYIAVSQERVLSDIADDNLANHAVLQAGAVEHVLASAAKSMDAIASNPVLISRIASRQDKSRQLHQAQDSFDVFEDITLMDPNGNVIDSTSYSYYGAWPEKPWFQEAAAGRPAISDAHFILSPRRLVVVFTAPVVTNGEVSAVVAGQLNMEHIWETLDSARIGSTGFLVAFDRNGNLVSHPNKDLLLTKLGGEVRSTGPETTSLRLQSGDGGDTLLGEAAPVNTLGWQVAALQSSGEVGAPVDDALQTILIAIVVVVVLTAAASLLLSSEIARPVSALAGAMRRIAAGDTGYRALRAGLKEIDDLTESFNTMAADLEASTRDLKSANEELARKYEELADARRQAATDSLTGLLNHRSLQEMLAREVKRAVRYNHHVSLLMIDVNEFKRFNDTYGHQAGDSVLRQVSDVLTRSCRTPDIVGRYGGDEFMVISPETDREGGITMANRILEALADERVHTADGEALPLALSIGVAACPEDSEHKEELLARADASLYQAKQTSGSSLVASEGESREFIDYGTTPLSLFDALVHAVDIKDRYTRRHSQIDAECAVELARVIGLSEGSQGALRVAGLLHDVGKIGIPDGILKKPGPLTAQEKKTMRQHVLLSTLIIQGVPNLRDVSDAVSCHHERWDGTGYPRGLKGPEIPLMGRILAVVDAYSAMVLDRPYRKALSDGEAVLELKRNAGTQLDPDLVAAFLRVLEARREAAA